MKIKLGLEISQAINFLDNFRVIMWFGKIFLGENELKKKNVILVFPATIVVCKFYATIQQMIYCLFYKKKIRGEWPVVYHLKKKLLA